MCTGFEIAALALVAVGTAATGYQTSESVQAGRRAKNAQENLETERKTQLAGEAAARAAAKTRAESAGSRAGLGSAPIAGSLGFGSGNTAPGQGGKLFGN